MTECDGSQGGELLPGKPVFVGTVNGERLKLGVMELRGPQMNADQMAAEAHASRYSRWSMSESSCQILHIAMRRIIFSSLAILPLQLGNDASRSTANVASYNAGAGPISLGRANYEIVTSSYAATSFSTCEMDETSVKTTFHQSCLVFVAPIRSYESKEKEV